MTYGFLHFQDLSTILPTTAELERQAAAELAALINGEPLRPQSIDDWPRITECIQRGNSFSLTATFPGFRRISLRFDTSAPASGDYEIHARTNHRGESGRVLRVTAVAQEELSSHQYSMLRPFPIRFRVLTSAADRQGSQKFWLVGISSLRKFSPEEIAGEHPESDT